MNCLFTINPRAWLGPVAAIICTSSLVVWAAPEQAEYVLRWDPNLGGPRTAQAALEALNETASKKEAYEIAYAEIARPPLAAPAGGTVIGRKRVEWDTAERLSGKGQLVIKYRGSEPQNLAGLICPFDKPNPETEVDVSFVLSKPLADIAERPVPASLITTRPAYSVTCESKKVPVRKVDELAFPPKVQAKAKCQSSIAMDRITTSTGLKIESWQLASGSLLEISQKASRTPENEQNFRLHVVRLLKAGAVPVTRSKSEAGADC